VGSAQTGKERSVLEIGGDSEGNKNDAEPQFRRGD